MRLAGTSSGRSERCRSAARLQHVAYEELHREESPMATTALATHSVEVWA